MLLSNASYKKLCSNYPSLEKGRNSIVRLDIREQHKREKYGLKQLEKPTRRRVMRKCRYECELSIIGRVEIAIDVRVY